MHKLTSRGDEHPKRDHLIPPPPSPPPTPTPPSLPRSVPLYFAVLAICIVCVQIITNYLANKPTQTEEHPHDPLPTAIIWRCQRSNHTVGTRTNCSSAQAATWHYPPTRPDPDEITERDRISAIGWKHMAEVHYFGRYEQWERYGFRHPLTCYVHCLQPYTVVWIDSNVFVLD